MTTEDNIKMANEQGAYLSDYGSWVNGVWAPGGSMVFTPSSLDAYTAKVRIEAYKRGHIDGLKGWEIIDVTGAIEQPSEAKEPCAAQWDEIARLNVGWMKANQAILGKDEEIAWLKSKIEALEIQVSTVSADDCISMREQIDEDNNEIVQLRSSVSELCKILQMGYIKLAAAHSSLCHIAEILHYPECWDTEAYPSLDSAVTEVFDCSVCANPEAHGIFPSLP